jgi:hypothetical protein
MKVIIGVGLIAIVGVLGTALLFMLRDNGGGAHRMLNALRLRVGLSMALLAFIWFSYWMGWIEPHRY